MKTYRAVLFDFDYTLGDSTGPVVGAFQALFPRMGWPVPEKETVRTTIGETLRNAYTRLTGDGSPEHQAEFENSFHTYTATSMITDTPLFPGAEELLKGLRSAGITVGIVSTKPTEVIHDIFVYQGLRPVLDLIVGGDAVKHNKPAPDSLLLALEKLNLKPEDALFCGDTVIDAETAQRAGVDFCAVLNGTTPESAFDAWPHVFVAQDLPTLHRALGL